MSPTLRKVGALCSKDFADLFKNPTMLVVCLMPVALMLLYRFVMSSVGGDVADGASPDDLALLDRFMDSFFLSAALCMSVGMVGSMTIIYGIAEEKEKHTLRTLMLANVTGGQIIAAKMIVALVAIAVVESLCFAASGVSAEYFAPYVACGVVAAIPLALISLVLGLMSRDQMTAGLYSVPVLIVALVPLFSMYSDGAAQVARLSPTGGMNELLSMVVMGDFSWGDAVLPVVVTLVWIALGAGLCLALCRKLLRDN